MRVVFSGMAVLAVVIAWSIPATAQRPEAAWTPTSDAPVGLLTPLEGQHHDRFIERSRAGDIDIVFFGTTETEMWLWRDRGRSVWDQAFGSRKAADFGTQGTRFESLLWRMRNGELDGYQAKVVVQQLPSAGVADSDNLADFVAKEAAIIAEIRARQPQAKILLFAAFPRGSDTPRRMPEANAALATLADDESVFYIDIGQRFFRPDGSFNDEMWSPDVGNRGTQTPAFKVWAEELQPWLDRFVR